MRTSRIVLHMAAGGDIVELADKDGRIVRAVARCAYDDAVTRPPFVPVITGIDGLNADLPTPIHSFAARQVYGGDEAIDPGGHIALLDKSVERRERQTQQHGSHGHGHQQLDNGESRAGTLIRKLT